MIETKAHIKDRMLRAATAAWGYHDKIDESSFDPLVAILLDVYAAELEKISNEIGASHERVLQQMMQIMAPDVLTSALPAHAVLHAASIEGGLLLLRREQFCSTHEMAEKLACWFAPAGDFRISDAVVRFQVAGDRCFRYQNARQREFAGTAARSLPANTIWLGIETTAKSLLPANFFFHVNHEAFRDKFLFYLPQARWWLDDQLMPVQPGYLPEAQLPADINAWLNREDKLGRQLLQQVQQQYVSQFVHLAEETVPVSGNDLPAALAGCLPDAIRKDLSAQPLRWIRIEFPDGLAGNKLDEVHCQANCFPVLNRRLYSLTHRLQHWINIIPLQCEDQFLDLHTVYDESGRSWLNETAAKGKKQPALLLRRIGANRFDERDVRRHLGQLLQLLREETAAFTLYGRDFIQQELQGIQQSINRLQQQLGKKNGQGAGLPFLEIADGSSHTLFIEFWATQGAAANGQKPGTPLLAYKNGSIRQTSVLLMTGSTGGRNELAPTETIPVFKSALLSKDRIMSEEDIRLYCLQQTGAITHSVEVKKGTMVGRGPHAGFLKTIDVHLFIHKKDWLQLQENDQVQQWQKRLAGSLSQRSLAMMPFRVYMQAVNT
ncbi:MAG: hypothetical protein QM664_09220 [Flavihumibacter sp.]